MNKVRSNRVGRVLWMVVQAVCTLAGVWVGCRIPATDTPRVVLIPLYTVLGFFFGLTLTVVWVLLYEALRFGLPGLVRRSAEKIHRGLPLRR